MSGAPDSRARAAARAVRRSGLGKMVSTAQPVFSRPGSRPACTNEDFPTPDFPTTGTSADAATASVSRCTAFSRPKNRLSSSFSNARSPLYGDVAAAAVLVSSGRQIQPRWVPSFARTSTRR